jgi:hypothetical protein
VADVNMVGHPHGPDDPPLDQLVELVAGHIAVDPPERHAGIRNRLGGGRNPC